MEGPKITVVIRKRPLGKKELAKGDQDIVQVQNQNTVILSEIKQKVDLTKFVEQHYFNFDLAFGAEIDNQGVYSVAVRPIIQAAFNKTKCTCFAYGQTGSGKTYTMLGDLDNGVPGLYLMASYDIFALAQKPEYKHLTITISFYEIYCGKLFDLLNDRSQLAAQEDAKGNVQIKGLSEQKITNVQQLMQIIKHGQTSRITSSNSANSESSRSHALLQISLKSGKQLHGKLSFIDLAGSERGADVRDQDKTTRVDGAEINKSLLALKECIRALDLNKNHTPFRGSKLTLVLKDSLVGNCKTVMIGNISPSSANSEHTLNTLRYADRVKELKKPQETKTNIDQNRELFLARGNNNVIRKEYKNPDSDDEIYGQGNQGNLKLTIPNQQLLQIPQIQIQRTQSAHTKIQQNEIQNNNTQFSNINLKQQLPSQPLFFHQQNQTKQSPLPPQQFGYQNNEQNANFFQETLFNQIPNPLIEDDDHQDNLLLEENDILSDQIIDQEEKNIQLEQDKRILQEEDEIIVFHRDHIDSMVDICKQDMLLLNSLDQNQVEVNVYMKQLKTTLLEKAQKINDFIQKLSTYEQLIGQQLQNN